jgi:hypothetical protein
VESSEGHAVEDLRVPIYLASLDGVEPYVHRFPTGIATVAPNLDPRRFMHPLSVRARLLEAAGGTPGSLRVGRPDSEFVAIGEVFCEVPPKVIRHGDWYGGPTTYAIAQTDTLAPNGTHYFRIESSAWPKALDSLQRQAMKLGGDAIIECFCGAGLSGFWHPPSSTWVSVFDPADRISSGYVVESPAMTSLSGWQLVGLAVRWKTTEAEINETE